MNHAYTSAAAYFILAPCAVLLVVGLRIILRNWQSKRAERLRKRRKAAAIKQQRIYIEKP